MDPADPHEQVRDRIDQFERDVEYGAFELPHLADRLDIVLNRWRRIERRVEESRPGTDVAERRISKPLQTPLEHPGKRLYIDPGLAHPPISEIHKQTLAKEADHARDIPPFAGPEDDPRADDQKPAIVSPAVPSEMDLLGSEFGRSIRSRWHRKRLLVTLQLRRPIRGDGGREEDRLASDAVGKLTDVVCTQQIRLEVFPSLVPRLAMNRREIGDQIDATFGEIVWDTLTKIQLTEGAAGITESLNEYRGVAGLIEGSLVAKNHLGNRSSLEEVTSIMGTDKSSAAEDQDAHG